MTMLENAIESLLAERTAHGHWIGELSTSALSTATSLFALHLHDRLRHSKMINAGLRWLIQHQNADGGWGDTVLSFSNISTTALCWAALSVEESPLTPSPSPSRGEGSKRNPLTPSPSPRERGARAGALANVAEAWLA